MSENCNNNCSSCGEDCSSRREPMNFSAPPHEGSNVKKVIGIVSGKGGVGKSMVTSMLAAAMQKRGKSTAILDADITGPSIPQAFGVHTKAMGDDYGIYPVSASNGTKIMSINLLLEDETEPVVWRGPVIAGTVKQFWTDIVWGDVDYMFVDMPPGTGDVPLTVFQSLPVDGIVVVTSPQKLVDMIVSKAVKMASYLDIPVLGIVENMSYYVCPSCGEKHFIFGDSRIEETAADFGIGTTARIPITPEISAAGDRGDLGSVSFEFLDPVLSRIEKL